MVGCSFTDESVSFNAWPVKVIGRINTPFALSVIGVGIGRRTWLCGFEANVIVCPPFNVYDSIRSSVSSQPNSDFEHGAAWTGGPSGIWLYRDRRSA